MGYKCGYKDEFIVPAFTQESGYWHRATKKFLPTLMLSTFGLNRKIGRRNISLVVFLTRCMRMGSGLMILMSTLRALPIPAGTANNALIAKE